MDHSELGKDVLNATGAAFSKDVRPHHPCRVELQCPHQHRPALNVILAQKLTAGSLSPSHTAPAPAAVQGASHLPSADDLAVIYSALENISLSRDGSVLLTRRHFDQSVVLLDTNTGNLLSSHEPESTGWFQLTADARHVALLAKDDRSVIFYDTRGWQQTNQTSAVKADIRRFALSPNGSCIAVAYVGGLQVWNLSTRSVTADVSVPINKQCYLAWSPNSERLVLGFGEGGSVWQARDWRKLYSWEGPSKNNYKYPVMAVGFLTDDTLLAGDNLGYLQMIDLRLRVRDICWRLRMPPFTRLLGTRRTQRSP